MPEQRLRRSYNRRRRSPRCWVPRESGGPAGSERFTNRSAVPGRPAASARPTSTGRLDRYNRLKLGGEFTQYNIDSYSLPAGQPGLLRRLHGAADPLERRSSKTGSTWATWSWSAASGTTSTTPGPVGWNDFPRISTMPLFDPEQPGRVFTNDSLFPKDQSHNYLSPHVQVSFPVTDRTNFRLSLRAPGAGAGLRR